MKKEPIFTLNIKCPTSWDDITVETMHQLEKFYDEHKDEKFNVLETLPILLNITKEEVYLLDEKALDLIFTHLSFLYTKMEIDEPSNVIVIDDVTYTVQPLTKMKVGEFVAAQMAIQSDKYDYATLLAILCRKENEDYTTAFENAELAKRVEFWQHQPVSKVLPLINFFLTVYQLHTTAFQASSEVKEIADQFATELENSEKSGALSHFSTKLAMRKLRKLQKSISKVS